MAPDVDAALPVDGTDARPPVDLADVAVVDVLAPVDAADVRMVDVVAPIDVVDVRMVDVAPPIDVADVGMVDVTPPADVADVSMVDAVPPVDAVDATANDGSDVADVGPSDAGPSLLVATPFPCGQATPVAGLPAGVVELADLGNVNPITAVTSAGPDRVLSTDSGGYWVLWDTTGPRQVASGDRACVIHNAGDPPCSGRGAWLAGTTLLDHIGTTAEVRSATDGSLLATFATTVDAQLGLALDGSYAWAANTTSLTMWSLTGTMLATRPGNYAAPPGAGQLPMIIGVPTEVRVGGGPAGAAVIEHIPLTGPASLSPAFAGTFTRWFADGNHFTTNVLPGDFTTRIYDANATMGAILSQYVFGGVGNYFWTDSGVYTFASPTTPVFRLWTSFPPVYSQSGSLVITVPPFPGTTSPGPTFNVTRLDPSGITVTSYPLPPSVIMGGISSLSFFGATDGGEITLVARDGRLFVHADLAPGTPARTVGCGPVWRTTGSTGGTAAASTAYGGVLLADLSPSGSTVRGVFPYGRANAFMFPYGGVDVGLSSDGTVLAMGSVGFVTLPSGSALPSAPQGSYFRMARSGTRVTDALGNVSSLAGTILFSVRATDPLGVFSPDGTMFASAPNIYGADGTLLGAMSATPAGWLDDEHVIAFQAIVDPGVPTTCLGAAVYDQTGVMLTPLVPLPCAVGFDLVSPTRAYYGGGTVSTTVGDEYRAINHLYDVTTGAVVWSPIAPAPVSAGGVAGGFVIEQSGNLLVAEPLPSPLP